MLRFPVVAIWVALAAVPVQDIRPLVETVPVPVDVDDPSIWVNPTDAGKSLIVGTIKRPKPEGGLGIYNLKGELLDRIRDIDRPNNVDILGDICVLTERDSHQLRVYRVGAEKPWLKLLGTVPVFTGQTGEKGDPMGVALYRRKSDKALFAMVSRRMGPSGAYLWQYRLDIAGDQVTSSKVREFGDFSGSGQIEAVAVDGDRELVYYADEDCCVRVWAADPDKREASREVARFATTAFAATGRASRWRGGGSSLPTNSRVPASITSIPVRTAGRWPFGGGSPTLPMGWTPWHFRWGRASRTGSWLP